MYVAGAHEQQVNVHCTKLRQLYVSLKPETLCPAFSFRMGNVEGAFRRSLASRLQGLQHLHTVLLTLVEAIANFQAKSSCFTARH